jgi:hypothetical protein
MRCVLYECGGCVPVKDRRGPLTRLDFPISFVVGTVIASVIRQVEQEACHALEALKVFTESVSS